MRATPDFRRLLMVARSSIEVPFERTSTGSPRFTPRRLASLAESSISGAGRWNWSSGTRSTAAPEKSGRYRSSCSLPPGGLGGIGPAGRQRVEHRDRQHALGPLGRGSDVRVGGGLVAGDDRRPGWLGLGAFLVRRGGPRLGNAAAVRRLR